MGQGPSICSQSGDYSSTYEKERKEFLENKAKHVGEHDFKRYVGTSHAEKIKHHIPN